VIYGEDVKSDVKVVDTGNRWIIARSVLIEAPAQVVFDVIADPRQHAAFDGSKTVEGVVDAPDRLALGDQFRMKMRIKVPYKIGSKVMEFEEGQRIAWAHVGGHRWRYETRATSDQQCEVTEIFDASYARSAQALRLMNAYTNNTKAIERTLCRLKSYVEESAAG